MPKTSPSRFTMVPLRKSSEPTATRRARILMAGLGIVAITGPVAMGVTLANANKAIDFTEVDPTGRGVADAAAFQMASDETVRVPTAKTFDPESVIPPRDVTGQDAVDLPYPVDNVTWTGFEVNTFTDGTTDRTFEVHKYLLVPDVDEYISDYLVDSGQQEAPAEDEAPATTQAPAPAPSESPAPPAADEPPADEEDEPADDVETGNTSMSSNEGTEDDTADETDESESANEQEAILEEGITPYQLEVPVLVTDKGPRLAGAPSLAPWTESEAAPAGEGDYSNYSSLRAESNSQTARQIGRWAVAYAEDDRETLLDLTGDADSSHEYVGLGGWAIPDAGSPVQVLFAINVNEGQQLLLRVRVLMEDARTDPESNENPYRMYSDFDVLVDSPETATPQIVSWGAAGSGASLSPYSTAIQK